MTGIEVAALILALSLVGVVIVLAKEVRAYGAHVRFLHRHAQSQALMFSSNELQRLTIENESQRPIVE